MDNKVKSSVCKTVIEIARIVGICYIVKLDYMAQNAYKPIFSGLSNLKINR